MSEVYTLTVTGSVAAPLIQSAFAGGAIPDEVAWIGVEINSPGLDEPTRVEAEGPAPKEQVKKTLEGSGVCESPNSITIECETSGGEVDEGSASRTRISDGGLNAVQVGSGEGTNDSSREYRGLSVGSNYYDALRAIAGADRRLTTDEIADIADVRENSVSPACRWLWDNRHVERWTTDSPEHEFVYRPTWFGVMELRRVEGE